MKNLALIVAGGSGSRFGGEVPKQYQKIGRKSVLALAVEAFLTHPQIDAVKVVISKEHEEFYYEDSRLRGNDKLLPFCYGGKERQDSVRLGLESVEKTPPVNVLIHDAARPYISHAVITNVLEGLKSHDAVVPVIGIKDSVRIDGASVGRDKIKIIQTPQGFNYKKILLAHQHHTTHWEKHTDDAQTAESAGMEIFFVEGDDMNKKITTNSDLRPLTLDLRTGMGYDVHEFTTGTHVTICGVEVPHSHALKGHSDADVGLHAITDAILGAIGAGDIGEHFPPSEAKWSGADSAIFLKHAASLVKGGILNIDVTIIAQEPKLTPYKAAMKAKVAEILGLDPARVNVKATTTEGLGFTGRKEGIAAQAVATINLIG